MKDLFFRVLKQRVSKRMQKPVTKDQILKVLEKVLVFAVLAFSFLLFVACFVFVCVIENNI